MRTLLTYSHGKVNKHSTAATEAGMTQRAVYISPISNLSQPGHAMELHKIKTSVMQGRNSVKSFPHRRAQVLTNMYIMLLSYFLSYIIYTYLAFIRST